MSNTNNELKKISFKSSKDFTDEDIAKLGKVTAKVCRKSSSKSKSVYYTLKLAIYHSNNKDRLIIVKPIQETLALIIAKRTGKDFNKDNEFIFNPSIRYSKGKIEQDDREYFAYDVFLCKDKRLFDFFKTDEIDYLNDYGFKLNFEERVYFDEDGYKYESLDF